jgi:farnesyl-diphosphate farnesyltransferase
MSQPSPHKLLTTVLRDVSRSFYLTLRILPAKIRPQIGLAYLLARTADTVADTEAVPLEHRLTALQALRNRILGVAPGVPFQESSAPAGASDAVQIHEFTTNQPSSAERSLLENCEASLALLADLNERDRQLVREVLGTITGGQELDLQRFAGASSKCVVALQTDEDLDDYTFRVAGCVGVFWTKICRAHLFPRALLDDSQLLSESVRFGKGLQLVNVLRDLARDLRQGRCYLPAEALNRTGLSPENLLTPEVEPSLRPVYDKYLDRAEQHLRAGWVYTNTIPRRQVRVRLACAWPILIGIETIGLLRRAKVLDSSKPAKVSRGRVRSLMAQSVLYYPFSQVWRRMVAGGAAVS